jgi:hypothetical protein
MTGAELGFAVEVLTALPDDPARAAALLYREGFEDTEIALARLRVAGTGPRGSDAAPPRGSRRPDSRAPSPV